MSLNSATQQELREQLLPLQKHYRELASKNVSLDLTRGKPSPEQVSLSDTLDGILKGNFHSPCGTDTRNYGGLDGLPAAREFFGKILDSSPSETMVGGNSSLTLMYQTMSFAMHIGLRGPASAWSTGGTVKFLCPTPGYDRHFAICEHLGIEMISVPLHEDGPDMDAVEALVQQDSSIKGMWCVPRFSNPSGCVYGPSTVARIAKLGALAGENFLIFWDNAYAVHPLYEDADNLASIAEFCRRNNTQDHVFQFGSTSKVTLPGAGVAFLASSERNLSALQEHLAFQTIGPDKVNQLRHLRFFSAKDALARHMEKHAAIIRPRFECILDTLQRELGEGGMGSWTKPRGGYFIAFDTLPGLAKKVVLLAANIGVKLTPAGATFPYRQDPLDSNIRLSPTFPTLEEVKATIDVFVLCVKLATLEQQLERSVE